MLDQPHLISTYRKFSIQLIFQFNQYLYLNVNGLCYWIFENHLQCGRAYLFAFLQEQLQPVIGPFGNHFIPFCLILTLGVVHVNAQVKSYIHQGCHQLHGYQTCNKKIQITNINVTISNWCTMYQLDLPVCGVNHVYIINKIAAQQRFSKPSYHTTKCLTKFSTKPGDNCQIRNLFVVKNSVSPI